MIQYVFKQRRRINGKIQVARTYSGRIKLDGEFSATTVALGLTDKQSAEEKLRKIIRERELERAGIIAPKPLRDAAQKALELHVEDYLRTLSTENRADKYVANLGSRLRILFGACAWTRQSDVTADSFVHWRTAQTKKSAKTLNDYLDAARAFLNWMVAMQRATLNPLENVGKVDGRGRKVRVRRAFGNDEIARLLAIAGKSRVGYLFAVYTGLRRNELKMLEWRDVELEGECPYVMVRAINAKNRTDEAQPLHPELAAELRAIKPADAKPTSKVFLGKMLPGMWKMKSDLKRAGIEYIKDGRIADFHALRHTLATNLALSGAHPREAMAVMRHSEIRLTMNAYTDARALPLAKVVYALPSFLSPKSPAEAASTQIRTQTAGAEGQDEAQRGADASDAFDSQIADAEGVWRELAQIDANGQNAEKAPAVGFEPTTDRLTADCSTTELRRIFHREKGSAIWRMPGVRATQFFADAADAVRYLANP